ncbi:type I glyceraldehyde-3-phosphate dehydrogenase [Candidatus Parcubacteria bacterium]|nr:type I glyceraldehyde-3-phosphate dehydrogenase [Candidatus Parcubacteria bacterium]
MAKIAINGFGRIGRLTFRNIIKNIPELEVVAINDLADNHTLIHLLKHDSSYGECGFEIIEKENSMIISGKEIKLLSEKDPLKLPWKDLQVDVVLECTGAFTKYDDAHKHIEAGAKRVILSAPSKTPDKVKSFVIGVNDDQLSNCSDDVIDMGSCTTNCLAPVVKILEQNFGIQKGFMTTVHSYTNDQNILDLPHKDLRRARSAGLSIIPTSTGAAKTVGKIFGEQGKLDGISMRVPTPTVSVVDFVCVLNKETNKEELNKIFKDNEIKGIFRVSDEPLVSMDYKGDSYSSILDSELTMVNGNLIKIVAWYDNDWGYSCRLGEFCQKAGK